MARLRFWERWAGQLGRFWFHPEAKKDGYRLKVLINWLNILATAVIVASVVIGMIKGSAP